MLLVWDNLIGHLNAELLLWIFSKGDMVLYTPLGGSWSNMSESIQRILVRRALAGEHPRKLEQIIEWLEEAARGWNRNPTPFEWGGSRAARRERARHRRHALGGSGACTRRPIRRRRSIMEINLYTSQTTHTSATQRALRNAGHSQCQAQALFVNLLVIPACSARHCILEASCLFLTSRTL